MYLLHIFNVLLNHCFHEICTRNMYHVSSTSEYAIIDQMYENVTSETNQYNLILMWCSVGFYCYRDMYYSNNTWNIITCFPAHLMHLVTEKHCQSSVFDVNTRWRCWLIDGWLDISSHWRVSEGWIENDSSLFRALMLWD